MERRADGHEGPDPARVARQVAGRDQPPHAVPHQVHRAGAGARARHPVHQVRQLAGEVVDVPPQHGVVIQQVQGAVAAGPQPGPQEAHGPGGQGEAVDQDHGHHPGGGRHHLLRRPQAAVQAPRHVDDPDESDDQGGCILPQERQDAPGHVAVAAGRDEVGGVRDLVPAQELPHRLEQQDRAQDEQEEERHRAPLGEPLGEPFGAPPGTRRTRLQVTSVSILKTIDIASRHPSRRHGGALDRGPPSGYGSPFSGTGPAPGPFMGPGRTRS